MKVWNSRVFSHSRKSIGTLRPLEFRNQQASRHLNIANGGVINRWLHANAAYRGIYLSKVVRVGRDSEHLRVRLAQSSVKKKTLLKLKTVGRSWYYWKILAPNPYYVSYVIGFFPQKYVAWTWISLLLRPQSSSLTVQFR